MRTVRLFFLSFCLLLSFFASSLAAQNTLTHPNTLEVIKMSIIIGTPFFNATNSSVLHRYATFIDDALSINFHSFIFIDFIRARHGYITIEEPILPGGLLYHWFEEDERRLQEALSAHLEHQAMEIE